MTKASNRAGTLEERLADLDRLVAAGTITAEERAAPRAALLGGK